MAVTRALPPGIPAEEAAETLLEAMSAGRTIFLVCCCEIDYSGRARSYLGPGERMIILKEDGTVIIHQKAGRNPVNWMPPKTRSQFRVESGKLVLACTKQRERESMRVVVSEVKGIETFHLEDYERIELKGTEKDFVRELISDPSLIEKGFRLTKNERVTVAGSIDISGVDSEGNPVVVEVKRSRAGPQEVIQLQRYVENLRRKTDEKVRGILVSPSTSSKARRLLVEYGLEHRRIHPLRLKRRRRQSDLSGFVQG